MNKILYFIVTHDMIYQVPSLGDNQNTHRITINNSEGTKVYECDSINIAWRVVKLGCNK